MSGIVKYITARALNDPSIDARARKTHANQIPNRGLVDQLLWNNVVERPINVRQVDINEHAGDLRAARARRIEAFKHALLGSHDSSESRPVLICVPYSAQELQTVLRDHHGEDTEHDETPQRPVKSLGDDTTQTLGRWDDAVTNVDTGDAAEHECRR